MSTSVPSPSLGPNGWIAPLASAILAGRQADINTAFGGDLGSQLTTPQGQLASTDTDIIADRNAQFLALMNSVDPAFAAGRMQDALGRIYYISRIPAQSTVVVAACVGAVGVKIPVGAQAIDQAENIYLCTQAGRIGISGTINLTFACVTPGPIACPGAAAPNGFLNRIYQAIPGWDSINNVTDGELGRNVETRADFEFRRAQSVAKNAQGSPASVQGAVLDVDGVLDALTVDNPLGIQAGAVVVASISGTVMTVSSVASGTIKQGYMVTGAGIADGTVIATFGTGAGGTGTYNLNISQTVSSETMQTTQFGLILPPHSLYVAAAGGLAQSIGEAIWSKKGSGCNYTGATTVTVIDTSNGYVPPYPSYDVTFRIPDPTPILFAVTLKTNASLPSNAADLVKAAITQSFTGADEGPRARIGSILFASRFYANIASLGSWVQIYSIKLGIAAATLDYIQLRGNQYPTITDGDIAVTFAA